MRRRVIPIVVGKKTSHGVCVWRRTWPEDGSYAWSCTCGTRWGRDLATLEDAQAEARAHKSAAIRRTTS